MKHVKSQFVAACCSWLIMLSPSASMAQETAGTLAGIVRDASQAVLPGVSVEVTSPALIEKVRSVTTDASGQYRIVNLPPGVYRVTFALSGFSTQVRGSIEVRTNFTTPISAQLSVGGVEETITVTGESPIVDVQTATQSRALTAQNFAEIPTGGTMMQMTSLIPGIKSSQQDVGGLTAESVGVQVGAHGGRNNDEVQMIDGMKIGNTWVGAGDRTNMALSPLLFEEVNIQISGHGADAPTLGVQLNAIPRSGGNRFSGTMLANGSTHELQADNLTSRIQNLGFVGEPNSIKKVYDVNGALGGPILRDRAWFFTTWRRNLYQNNIFGMYMAEDPTAYQRLATGRQAFDDTHLWDGNGRMTMALSSRQKLTAFGEYQLRCGCAWALSATVSPEASQVIHWPTQLAQVVYTNTLTNRLLLEAGFNYGDSRFDWLAQPEVAAINEGLTPFEVMARGVVPVVQQAGVTTATAPLTYRAPTAQLYSSATALKRYSQRASLTYTTGSHYVKVGMDNTFGFREPVFISQTGYISYRVRDGVPNQLTLYAPASPTGGRANEVLNMGLFAQDRWTRKRLTLTGGLRFDINRGSVDAFTNGATPWIPARGTRPSDSYPRITGVPSYQDVSPRIGVAYDLFGKGKTALKFSAARSIEQNATGIAVNNAPSATVSTSTTRVWNDADRDFFPDCNLTNPLANGECEQNLNSSFGNPVPSTTYDPRGLSGWGVRPWTWEFSAGVQHQITSRVSANFAVFRRVNGNFRVTDNVATTANDYRTITLTAPVDARLPAGGAAFTLYDITPGLVAATNNFVTLASNYGRQIDRWNGFDITLDARVRGGFYVQGGMSAGQGTTDNCAVVQQIPEVLGTTPREYCRQLTGYQPQAKFLGSYTIPWYDIRVSGAFQSLPGPQISANVIYTGVQVLAANPGLGAFSSGGAGQKTVNVLEPGVKFNDRLNQLDLRFAKIVKTGRGTRLELSADLYNVFNSDAILSQTNDYGVTWLRPTSLVSARFTKFTARFDF